MIHHSEDASKDFCRQGIASSVHFQYNRMKQTLAIIDFRKPLAEGRMGMERHTRVYPAESRGRGWLSGLLLFLSAAVVLSGLVWRERPSDLSIQAVATATPIPLDSAFDETPVQEELTLPGATWYALQLGAFENEAAARQISEQYARRGAAGYVWHDNRYRALAALYATQEDAQNVRVQLEKQHSIDTYLYPVELPAIRVRLSGMRGQLDILQAAFVHGGDLVSQLQRLSVSLDRQEANAQEAVQALQALCGQVEAVALRLKQRFTAPRHQAVEGLIACMEDYMGFCSALDTQESNVSLSARVKGQAFQSLELLKRVYDSLSHT